jgi:hypothetical protein
MVCHWFEKSHRSRRIWLETGGGLQEKTIFWFALTLALTILSVHGISLQRDKIHHASPPSRGAF